MNRKQYAKIVSKLSTMTIAELWQHYAELNGQPLANTLEHRRITLNGQPLANTLEHRCITLSELSKRGISGLIIDGELVR